MKFHVRSLPVRERFWVVDAAQGIEASNPCQRLSALDNDLEIMPVINKIDLPAADPERVRTEIEDVIGLDASEAVFGLLLRLESVLKKSLSKS